MAIKFIPSSKRVTVEGQEEFQTRVLSALSCIADRVRKVELQLEILTDDQIDDEEGLL